MTELRSELPQHYNIYRIPGVERDTIDTYLIIYCVAGRGWFRSNDKNWVVTRGDIVFVRPNTPHAYRADRDEPWTIQWAHFSGRATEPLLKLANVTPEQPVTAIGERLNIVALFDEILKTLQAGYNLHYLINAAAYLRQILTNIALLSTYSPPISSEDLNAEKIIHFMLDNLTMPCKLDDFAAQAAMSRAHFVRKFRETTGYSPVDYFIRLKIQKACELLETTDMKIGEISRQLGYGDQYYFSRIFKKIMGASPKQYRLTSEV